MGIAQAKPSAQLTCEGRKLKAQGALEVCLKQNNANMLNGAPDRSARCEHNFTTALATIDAAAAKVGAACRYLDDGDGTVSDLNTGLVWEQKTGTIGVPNAADVHDVNNAYAWSNSGTAPDGPAFTNFLYTLNNGVFDGTAITGCFANHCDWRLPTILELQGIVRPCNPTIDPIFGPTQSGWYWSATSDEPFFPDFAYGVPFFGGPIGATTKTMLNFVEYVRAVRGGL